MKWYEVVTVYSVIITPIASLITIAIKKAVETLRK